MFLKLRSFFYPLQNDPDEIRRHQIMDILSKGLLGLSILALIFTISFVFITNRFSSENILLVIVALISVLVSLGILYTNKSSSRISSLLFLFLLMLVATFGDTPEQVSNGRSLFLFALPIVVSSLILTPISSFIFAFVSDMIIFLLAQQTNLTPNSSAMIGFIFLAVISWMSARSLEQALKDLRTINADLDKIVIERTNELADALTRERIEAGRSQAILNSIADGVIVFDRQNVATLVNPALSQLTDIPIQKLRGISLIDFVHAKDIPQASQQSIIELIQKPDRPEDMTPRLEWGEKVLSASVARVQDSQTNEIIGSVAVFRDITYETQIEKMKDNFVAVVSHELRTPLNAIMGHVEILKEEVYGTLNEKQVSVAQRIMVNVTRLLNMVADLLNEAQIRAGKLTVRPEAVKTSSLVESLHIAMDKIIADKGLELITTVSEDMPNELIADPQRLQQILINLASNALKFTEIGSITVSIGRAESDRWKIETTDTGLGIPESEIPFIFEAFRQANNLEFTTRQHGGIGLGLSIVKQLVELMNGEIQVKSALGKGTTFTVLLPLVTK